MFGLFKKKARQVIAEVKKMESRDAVEATVWGGYSIACADGICSCEEISVIEKIIHSEPAFSASAVEIANMSDNIRAQYEASPCSANAQAMRELADIVGTPEAVDVLSLCLDVSGKNGIDKAKEKQLKKIRMLFSCHLSSIFDRNVPQVKYWCVFLGSGGFCDRKMISIPG